MTDATGPPPQASSEGASEPDRQRAQAALEAARSRITEVDDALIRLIGERRELALRVGEAKAVLGLPVLDPAREAEVVRNAAVRARALGVDEELARDVIWRIIASVRAAQEGRPGGWPDEAASSEPPSVG